MKEKVRNLLFEDTGKLGKLSCTSYCKGSWVMGGKTGETPEELSLDRVPSNG
jgi:hypothetical protein